MEYRLLLAKDLEFLKMEDHKMLTQRTTEIKRMLASLIAEAEG